MEENQEVEILDVILHCWEKKFLILSVTSIFALMGVIYSLSVVDLYMSESLLVKTKDGPRATSSIDSVMKAAGVNVAAGTIDDGHIAEETIHSREFLAHLLQIPAVWPSLMASIGYDKDTKKIIFDKEIYNPDEDDWSEGGGGAPSFMATYKEYRRNVIDVEYDRSTGFMWIRVTHMSPIFAKEFLDIIIEEVNEKIRLRDLARTNEHLDFLTKEIKSTGYMEIKFAMNSILEGQLIEKMQSMISKEYTLTKVYSPFIPQEKVSPKRTRIVVLFTLFGAFLSVVFVSVKQFFLTPFK